MLYLHTYFFLNFFIVLIIAAYFCFKFYEKPMNSKIRTVFSKKKQYLIINLNLIETFNYFFK